MLTMCPWFNVQYGEVTSPYNLKIISSFFFSFALSLRLQIFIIIIIVIHFTLLIFVSVYLSLNYFNVLLESCSGPMT